MGLLEQFRRSKSQLRVEVFPQSGMICITRGNGQVVERTQLAFDGSLSNDKRAARQLTRGFGRLVAEVNSLPVVIRRRRPPKTVGQ